MIHPVLSELRERYPFFTVLSDGLTAGTSYPLDSRAKQMLIVHVFAKSHEETNVSLQIAAFTRATLSATRTRLYLKELTRCLAERNIELIEESPCRFILTCNLITEEGGERSIDEIFHVIERLADCGAAVVRLAKLTARLQSRGGTDAYRKLLPTRLAEHTLHGLFDGATQH